MLYFARLAQPQRGTSFLVILLAGFLTAPVQAQETTLDAEPQPPAGRRRYQISVFTGVSLARPSDLRLLQPSTGTDATFWNVHWKGHPFQGSRYYGYRVMTYLPRQPRVGIGLDFVHYKVYAQVNQDRRVTGTWQGDPVNTVAPMRDRVQEFRITNGVNAITLTVNYRCGLDRSNAFPEGRLQPYVGGGPSYYLMFPINKVNNKSNKQHGYQSSGFGYTLQAGVRYGVFRRGAVFLETRYNRGDAKVEIADGGKADTDLRTTHIQGGFTLDL
jgi:opacity protein-like surface antigen